MAAEGWIKLHRKITENELFLEKRVFSKFEAWIDLLLTANHETKYIMHGNRKIKVNRGQLITSELKLMKKWGWSKTKLRNFIFLLENEKMIKKISDKKKTTITICNYSLYQDTENQQKTTKKPLKDHEKTTERLLKDTNKNDKNIYIVVDNIEHAPEVENEEKPDYILALDYFNKKANKIINTPNEIETAKSLLLEMPLEIIKKGIDIAFDNYKKVDESDKINSFVYCKGIIRKLWEAEQAKNTEVVRIDEHCRSNPGTKGSKSSEFDENKYLYKGTV